MKKAFRSNDENYLKHLRTRLTEQFLNMPDGGSNESPMHMACKYGLLEIVELFAGYPELDINRRNKYGQNCEDLICALVENPNQRLIDDMKNALQGQYVVHLVDSANGFDTPKLLVSPSKADLMTSRTPESSPAQIYRARIGPMSPKVANEIKNKWKSSRLSKSDPELDKLLLAKSVDSTKGYESVGRYLAKRNHLQWDEYWGFLKKSIDITSYCGLNEVNTYFLKKCADETINYLFDTFRALVKRTKPEDIIQLNIIDSFDIELEELTIGSMKSDSNCNKSSIYCNESLISEMMVNLEARRGMIVDSIMEIGSLLSEGVDFKLNETILDFAIQFRGWKKSNKRRGIFQLNTTKMGPAITIYCSPYKYKFVGCHISINETLNSVSPSPNQIIQKVEETDVIKMKAYLGDHKPPSHYIEGHQQTKHDVDLANALSSVPSQELQKYAFIHEWLHRCHIQ